MSREMYLMDSMFLAALLAGGMVERQDVVRVIDDVYPEPPTEPMRWPPEPAGPTAADLERLRLAAVRRARKVAKQARGFSPPQVKEGGH